MPNWFVETELTVALYYVKSVFAFFTIPPLIVVLLCYHRFPAIRNRRIFFTIYSCVVDCLSRTLFLCYYSIRIHSVKHGELDYNCDVFSTVLYFAQALPISSFVQLQLHTLAAAISPEKYSRYVGTVASFVTVSIHHLLDLSIAIATQQQLIGLIPKFGWYDLTYGCKFEFFSRFPPIYSWYLLVQLILIGLTFLSILITSLINRRKARSNPVANSPFNNWEGMTKPMRILSISITVITTAMTICYIASEITYLLHANSTEKQILSLSLSVFSVTVPVQIIWLNRDMRIAVFELFGRQQSTKTVIRSGTLDSLPSSNNSTTDLLHSQVTTDNL